MRSFKAKIFSLLLLACGLWFFAWCQPEKQVRRAQARLFDAIQEKDFDALAQYFSEDYRDRWGHTKADALGKSSLIFSQFILLDFERSEHDLIADGEGWKLSERLKIKGLGSPVAIFARDEVNALQEPFFIHWRKSGWEPWNWQISQIEQSELALP